MNHAIKATAHENKIRRWPTFTPPQSTAHAAHCGLVLHRRTYIPDLVGRIDNLVAKIDRDIARIKRSKIRASVKERLPIGIGSAVTLGTAFVHDSPNLKFVTGATTVALQIVTEALHSKPLPARLEGTQSLLLSAQKDILHAKDMAKSLRITPQ